MTSRSRERLRDFSHKKIPADNSGIPERRAGMPERVCRDVFVWTAS
jgi:hypothetical protein